MNVLNDQIWQDFLKIIREEVGTRVVETWIKAVTISRYDSTTGGVYLSAPNLFVKNWVESNYKDLFQKHLKRLLGVEQITIHFLLGSVLSSEPDLALQESSKIIPAISASPKKKKYELVKKMSGYQVNPSRLNPIYTFDTF